MDATGLKLVQPDSDLFGAAVLELSLPLPGELAAAEQGWIQDYDPCYVYAKCPVRDLESAGILQSLGFQWVETQLEVSRRPHDEGDLSIFPYRFEQVRSEEDLQPVLEIAAQTFIDDRITADPLIPEGPRIAGARFQWFIRQTFTKPEGRVFRLIEEDTGRTLAFKTWELRPGNRADGLLGGAHPDYREQGLSSLAGRYQFRELEREGVKRFRTHVSTRNLPVMNMIFAGLGYRILSVNTVFRKWYR